MTGVQTCALPISMLGLAGAVRGEIRVFSYEGPFGVGYCSALWEPSDAGASHGGTSQGGAAHGEAPGGEASEDHPCARLARETVTRLLEGRPLPASGTEAAPSELWAERRACFVLGWESGGFQARGHSATCPGFG